jgi:hypothetical protein
VIVDLPGPKLRTEIRQLEQPVLHLPRRKDQFGRTMTPTRVLLVAEHAGEAQIPVPPQWLPRLEAGDVLGFTDSGERDRSLVILGPDSVGVVAESVRSLYVTPGLELVWRRGETELARGQVGICRNNPRFSACVSATPCC